MANTLKFGSGQWGTKVGSALAYNDEDGNFKPLPFNFTRSTSGTRINKDGLIEVVTNNKPRIDFLNDSNGALLLEPIRTNLITYSEDFSQWTGGGINITPNDTISPNGTLDANKVESTNAFFGKYIQPTVSSGVHYTASVFVKNANDNNSISFRLLLGTNDCRYIFNIEDLTVTAISGYTSGFVSSNIEDYGNGWVKCSLTVSSNGTSSVFAIYPKIIDTAETKSANLWGAQLEQGYQTSYIPTQGAISTREAESFTTSLPDNASFNSSNGFSVISKFGIGAAGSGTSSPFISFNDDTANTYIAFGSSSVFRCRLNLGGVAYLNSQGNALRTQENSLFISCDANGWSQGANGVTNYTGNENASIYNKLSSISCTTSEFFGIIRIKELSVYNTRLTNAELQALTS